MIIQMGMEGLTNCLKDAVVGKITDRIKTEIKPDVDKLREETEKRILSIYQEEVAKIGLEISRMMTIERAGQEIRIMIYDQTGEKILKK